MTNKKEIKLNVDTTELDKMLNKINDFYKTLKKPTHWQMNWLKKI